MLEGKGLVTVEDLLGYVPFRYEDRSNVTVAHWRQEMATAIVDARPSLDQQSNRDCRGAVHRCPRAVLLWLCPRGTRAVWAGVKAAVYGKVELVIRRATMLHPEFEISSGDDDEGEASLHTGGLCRFMKASASPRGFRVLDYIPP
jgi:ATP-dependent DNA helicase RecG